MSNHSRLTSIVLASFSLAACSSEPPGAALGATCAVGADCESAMCIDAESRGGSYCSATCVTNDDCDGDGAFLTCDAAGGFCYRPCLTDDVRGSGAGTEVCVAGHFIACSSQRAADACRACGCEPFGGGMCVAGSGCFVPQPDGSPCTLDSECSSGACYRDTEVCGAPRSMGAPCSVDAECATQNCSTDGDATMVGHCNQQLGSSCSAPMTGRNVTATCNNCQIRFGDSAGYCLRPACDPVNANHCPSFAGHEFRCDRSTEGTYHCFEVCADEFDDCYYDTVSCRRAGDFCR